MDGREKEHLLFFLFLLFFFSLYVLRNGRGIYLLEMPPRLLVQMRKWKGGTERRDRRARLSLGLWSFFLQDNGPILIYYITLI